MKILGEILLSIILHPVAMVLMWINVASRTDLGFFRKAIWIALSILWGLGPILYLLVGDGTLW